MSVKQYDRKVVITVTMTNGDTLSFTTLRITFSIVRGDIQTPNTADVRIYNPSGETANTIMTGADSIVIEAGYEGNFGILFSGQVKQRRTGREDQLNTWVDITAVDGDEAYNFSTLALNVARGMTPQGKIDAFLGKMVPFGIAKDASADAVKGNGAVRGQTFYGFTRDEMRSIAADQGYRWSIQEGKLVLIPLNAYLPGDVPIISPSTGLIGVPQQTDSGLNMRILINPAIKIGQKISLQDTLINQIAYSTDIGSQGDNAMTRWFNKLSLPGDYYVMSIDVKGDTRGQEYYMDLTCLAVNSDVPPALVGKYVDSAAGSAILDANMAPPPAGSN